MRSYIELTRRYLGNQKKRTILTLIGIILSTSLIMAIGTMAVSLRQETINEIKRDVGDYHTFITGVTKAELDILRNHAKVEAVGYISKAAMAAANEKYYIELVGYDKKAIEIFDLKVAEGRLPQASNEIALERWILYNMKSKPKIGDTITLELEDSDTVMKRLSGDAPAAQASSHKTARQFVLTGITENRKLTQLKGVSRAIITPETTESILSGSTVSYDAYIRIKNSLPIQKSIDEVLKSLNAGAAERRHDNNRLLGAIGQTQESVFNRSMYIVMGMLALLIMISTIAVIYNAFHISVLERIKQFGVLRSIGAAPGQIRKIVLREAGLMSIIGVPVGIACGMLGVRVTLWLLSFSEFSHFKDMSILLSPAVMAISAVLGTAAVFLSAMSPAFLAGRVSPLRAILNTKEKRHFRKKTGRYSSLGWRLFRSEGMMAWKNLNRNRKRFAITAFSMCIGIVLYIVFNGFIHYTLDAVHGGRGLGRDYRLYAASGRLEAGFSEKDYQSVKAMEGVEKIYKLMSSPTVIAVDDSRLTKEYRAYLAKPYDETGMYQLSAADHRYINYVSTLIGYDESTLAMCRAYLDRGSLNMGRLEQEHGVLVIQAAPVRDGLINLCSLKPGDEIMLNTGTQYVPDKLYRELTGKADYQGFDIDINKNADRSALRIGLGRLADSVAGGSFYDFEARSKNEKQAKLEMSVFLYGFVAIISLIGVLNIINTISTNLILRIREFGTLRAVGMTSGQMKRMISLEGILYGLVGAAAGSTLGSALLFLLYRNIDMMSETLWSFPWHAIITASLATILAALISTIVPLTRISEMNIIDSVRVEE